jgi:hypothetical protein
MLPALAGALAFELFPKSFAHYGAGHVTLLFAVAWTPWLLLVEHLQDYVSVKKVKLLPAVVLGFILLADVRWGLYAGTLWLLYSLHLQTKDGYYWQLLLRWIRTIVSQAAVAALIAAPLLLPLLEYTRLSTRHTMTAEESLILALPPAKLLGLLYPDLAAYAEWTIYPGALALLMLVWSLFHSDLRKRSRFWIWALVVTLLIALGPGIPIIGAAMQYIVRLPLLNLLRVPTRAIFIMGLAFAALLAHTLDFLSEYRKPAGIQKQRFGPGLVLVGITAFGVLLAAGVSVVSAGVPLEFAWGALALTIFCILILLRQSERISGKAWLLILLPLLVLDLGGAGYSQIEFRENENVLAEGNAAAGYLAAQDGLFRIYSPSYSLPQQTAATHGLQLADGVDPMALQTYTQFMDSATGVPRNGYSVTLPPLEGEDVHQVNQNYLPDAHLLGLLNVRYVAAEFPLDVPGLRLYEQFGSTHIYQNEFGLPRAWVQDETESIGVNVKSIDDIRLTPNRIELTAPGPGLLVLSELDYPGWQVSVNGEKAEIQSIMGLLRGVYLTGSENQVIFAFRPVSLYAGLILAATGWILIFSSIWKVAFVR